MALSLRLRAALFVFAVLFHGMGLCVAPVNEASAGYARAQTGAGP
jgi:hypothetical protein